MIRLRQDEFDTDVHDRGAADYSPIDQEAADRDLERRVATFLADRHLPSLRRLRVEARCGTVTLRGQVRTFYEKQVSHHSARRVAGVLHVVDAIDVAAALPALSASRSGSPVLAPSVLDLPQMQGA